MSPTRFENLQQELRASIEKCQEYDAFCFEWLQTLTAKLAENLGCDPSLVRYLVWPEGGEPVNATVSKACRMEEHGFYKGILGIDIPTSETDGTTYYYDVAIKKLDDTVIVIFNDRHRYRHPTIKKFTFDPSDTDITPCADFVFDDLQRRVKNKLELEIGGAEDIPVA